MTRVCCVCRANIAKQMLLLRENNNNLSLFISGRQPQCGTCKCKQQQQQQRVNNRSSMRTSCVSNKLGAIISVIAVAVAVAVDVAHIQLTAHTHAARLSWVCLCATECIFWILLLPPQKLIRVEHFNSAHTQLARRVELDLSWFESGRRRAAWSSFCT